MIWFLVFAVAFLATACMTPLAIKVAHRYSFLDLPSPFHRGETKREKKPHLFATPRVGGLVMVLSFTLSSCLLAPNELVKTISLCSFGVFFLGFIDDIKPIRAFYKLIGQIFFASLFLFLLGIYNLKLNLFGFSFLLQNSYGFLLSLFILVGAMNAFNMIDGLDGLSSGLALISLSSLAYMHFLMTKELWLISPVAVSAVGVLLGFLRYNSHPAKIFMGDGGSLWLGFLVGVFILASLGGMSLGSLNEASSLRVVPFTTVLLAVALPVFDTFSVIYLRLSQKKSPLSPDHNHFHHILLDSGLGQKRVVASLYFFALVLAILGLLPVAFPRYPLLRFFPEVFFVLSFIFILSSKNKIFRSKLKIFLKERVHQKALVLNEKKSSLTTYWFILNKYIVYMILGVSPLFIREVPLEISYASLGFLPVILISLFFKTSKDDFIQAFFIALAVGLILVAINTQALSIKLHGKEVFIHPFYNASFFVLGLSVLGFFLRRFHQNFFWVSPSDFILLTIPLALLLVPDPWQSMYKLGTISARCFVVFIALRTLMFQSMESVRRVKVIVSFILAYLAVKGLFGLQLLS